MNKPQNICRKCGVPLEGGAVYCIICFAELLTPCPDCLRRGSDGDYRLRRQRGKVPAGDCATCKNRLWILRPPNE